MDDDAKNDISYGGVAAGIGGLVGLLGVFIGWWEYTASVSGQGVTVRLNGTDDWTGVTGLVAAITVLAFGAAYVILSDLSIRKMCAFIVALAGVVLAAAAVAGSGRASEVVGTPGIALILGPGTQVARGVALGLWASAAGGIISIVGAILNYRQLSSS